MRAALALLAGLALSACDAEPVLSGRYHYGGVVDIVCPCGTALCYWVRATPEITEQLHNYTQRQAREPYQAIYLRWRGRLLDEPRVGFPANYDGLMAVDEVLTLTVSIPQECAAL